PLTPRRFPYTTLFRSEQPRRLVLVPPALAQRGGEQAALDLLERRHVTQIDGGCVGGREPAHGGGQVVERDRVGDREREGALDRVDRKSTRLNSSHRII